MCIGEQIAFQSGTNSNYLAILAPRAEGITGLYEYPGYEAILCLVWLCQRIFFHHTGTESSVDDSRHVLSF